MEAASDIVKGSTSAFTVGGGSIVSGVCTITVGSGVLGGTFEDRETIALAGVVPSNNIILSLAAHLDSDENDPEFLAVSSIAGVAGAGSFDVVATFLEPTSGQVKLIYMVI